MIAIGRRKMVDRKGFHNKYNIIGDTTEIIIKQRNGKIFKVLIDTEDLQKLIDADLGWHVRYDKCTDDYYCRANKRHYDENDKFTYAETIMLHRFIKDVTDDEHVVDHHNHNRLDNRKVNLFVTAHTNNSTNRKSANSNNKSGVRNVSYIEKANEYWVQMMKNGKRYRWVFSATQFEEACEFAEKKRKELFGKYAGNS